MAIPICDHCAKTKLGNLYKYVNKKYTFAFFLECCVCNEYFKEKYAIPTLDKDKNSLAAIISYLKELKGNK